MVDVMERSLVQFEKFNETIATVATHARNTNTEILRRMEAIQQQNEVLMQIISPPIQVPNPYYDIELPVGQHTVTQLEATRSQSNCSEPS